MKRKPTISRKNVRRYWGAVNRGAQEASSRIRFRAWMIASSSPAVRARRLLHVFVARPSKSRVRSHVLPLFALTFQEGCDKKINLTGLRGTLVKTAVIILGHGSRSAGADHTVRKIIAEVKKLGGYEIVEPAFLQYIRPTLQDALESCIRQKAEKITIVPFFMQPGAHVTRGIPELAEKARKQHPGIDIVITDFAGSHPLMAQIAVDLVKQNL